MSDKKLSETIALGADHGGFRLKNLIKGELVARGYTIVDLGTNDEASVDYPDYGHEAAKGIVAGTFSRAILVCGTGVGMAIAANRHAGVRAVNCSDTFTARMSRSHNASNVLALGERVVGASLAMDIVDAWLGSEPSTDPRHVRRVAKLEPS